MKAAAKYLFDEHFASGEKHTITMVEYERRRVDAESQAYPQGFTAGEAQAQQDAAQRTAAALAVIGEGLARLDNALTAIETRLEIEAVEVAVAVAAKLAPALIAREPMVEIAALAAEALTTFWQPRTSPCALVQPSSKSPRRKSTNRAGPWL